MLSLVSFLYCCPPPYLPYKGSIKPLADINTASSRIGLDAKIDTLAVADSVSQNLAVTSPGEQATIYHTHGASTVHNVHGNQYHLNEYRVGDKPDGKFSSTFRTPAELSEDNGPRCRKARRQDR